MTFDAKRRGWLPALIVALAFAAFALGACGGDDDDDDSAATTETQTTTTDTTTTETTDDAEGETVEVSADPDGQLRFEQESLTASAGTVTFEFENSSQTPHDFVIEKDGEDVGKTDVISDDTDTVTVELEPGEYTYYCSVSGHRQAGMEGTLTVE